MLLQDDLKQLETRLEQGLVELQKQALRQEGALLLVRELLAREAQVQDGVRVDGEPDNFEG